MNSETMEVHDASAGYVPQVETPVMPQGYKQTEVGVIPEDWSVDQVGNFSEVGRGRVISHREIAKSFNPTYPVYSSQTSNNGVMGYLDTYDFEGEFVTWTTDGANAGTVFHREGRFNCTNVCGTIKTNKQDARFISRVLSRVAPKHVSRHLGNPKLMNDIMKHVSVPLPPIKEQRAIATAVSDVDALLEALDRLIAKKRNIKQATMQQLLTGQTRLPGFEGEWARTTLGEVASFYKGKGIPKSAIKPHGERPCIHYGELFTKYGATISETISRTDEFADAFFSASNDVLMPTSDVTPKGLAKASCITVNDVVLGGDILIIRGDPDVLNGTFLSQIIRMDEDQVLKLVTGTTVYHLYGSDMQKFEFTMPGISEQNEIIEVLADIEHELAALKQRRTKTAALKQAMMQELLTGRTRLVSAVDRVMQQSQPKSGRRRANVHFKRSVFAAEIVDQLHEEPTFGHVKLEKVLYLAEHLCDVDTGSTYYRKAAGPYDNRALRSIDSQIRKQQWFEARQEKGRYRYVPLNKRAGYKQYFYRYFSDVEGMLCEVVEAFRELNTERCEIVATLFSAWQDLLREHDDVSDEMIVNEVLHHWHESKRRIAKGRWLRALGWMRGKGFVPKGETSEGAIEGRIG